MTPFVEKLQRLQRGQAPKDNDSYNAGYLDGYAAARQDCAPEPSSTEPLPKTGFGIGSHVAWTTAPSPHHPHITLYDSEHAISPRHIVLYSSSHDRVQSWHDSLPVCCHVQPGSSSSGCSNPFDAVSFETDSTEYHTPADIFQDHGSSNERSTTSLQLDSSFLDSYNSNDCVEPGGAKIFLNEELLFPQYAEAFDPLSVHFGSFHQVSGIDGECDPATGLSVVENCPVPVAESKVEECRASVVLPKLKRKRSKDHSALDGSLTLRRNTKYAVPNNSLSKFRAFGSARSKMSDSAKEKTARTRAIGACKLCTQAKSRCGKEDRYIPCGLCVKKFFSTACCGGDIMDIKLVRLGSAANPQVLQKWTESKAVVQKQRIESGLISYEPPRQVFLTHDFSGRLSFPVTVSRFEPDPSDVVNLKWTDETGKQNHLEMPAYYISDVDAARKSYKRYVWDGCGAFHRTILKTRNPIIRTTFLEAERYQKETKSHLVATALYIWSATRTLETVWLICGMERLGIPTLAQDFGPFRINPNFPSSPVTPIMDTQLDELAVEAALKPATKKILKLLHAKLSDANPKKHWYEVYLTSFIMLQNFERILWHFKDFGRRFGFNENAHANGRQSLGHAYQHSCNTILAYFHAAAGSLGPLTPDLSENDMNLTAHQLRFIRETKAEILRQGENLRNTRQKSMYDTEMYWCAQMLFSNWRSDIPHKEKILEYTEEDFLLT